MSGTFDDELVNSWLNCLRDNPWCSLHYESPALYGLGRGEIFGGGYVRRRLEFSEPSNKIMWSLNNVKFIGLNANRLTHFGVWNHKETGKIRGWGELPNGGVLVPQGGGYSIKEGKIALSLD